MLGAILAEVNPAGPDQRPLRFISGTDDGLLYDVFFRNITSEISSIFNCMLSIAQETWGLQSIGNHISQNFSTNITSINVDQRFSTHWCLSWTLESQNSISIAYQWDVLHLVVKVILFADHTTYEADLVIGMSLELKVSSATPLSVTGILFSLTRTLIEA